MRRERDLGTIDAPKKGAMLETALALLAELFLASKLRFSGGDGCRRPLKPAQERRLNYCRNDAVKRAQMMEAT